jgi:hypothetical protein
VCWLPGLEEFKVATSFPAIYTGVGMTCRRLEHSDFGSVLEQNGRTLIKALEFIAKLP